MSDASSASKQLACQPSDFGLRATRLRALRAALDSFELTQPDSRLPTQELTNSGAMRQRPIREPMLGDPRRHHARLRGALLDRDRPPSKRTAGAASSAYSPEAGIGHSVLAQAVPGLAHYS